MSSPKAVDMETLRVFYDPHPGFGGVAVPIPRKIKKVADELSGQTMSLREAVKRLRAARIGHIEVAAENNFIRLYLANEDGSYIEHIFCVIKYR